MTKSEDRPVLAPADPAPKTGRHTRGRQGIVLTLWDNVYPVLVFGAVNAAIFLSKGLLGPAQRKDFSYLHGDPAVYLWVSQSGYSLLRCPSVAPYPPGSWCGNTGWQPLYPWLIKVLAGIGISPTAAAVVIAEDFALGVFLLLWRVTAGAPYRKTLLLSAAVFPGIVYVFGLYPISMLIFLALSMFVLLEQRKFAWAMIPAFLIPLTYSSAVLVLAVLALWWVVFQKLRDWTKVALVLGAATLGYLLFLAVLKSSVGTWKAEFLVQSKYGNSVHDPLATLLNLILPGTRGNPGPTLQTTQTSIVPYQALLVLFLMILVTYVVARQWKRLTVLDQLVACWTYVFWLAPLVVGLGISSYRSNALLLPMVILFRYLSRPVLIAVVVLSAPVAYVVTTQVMTGQLL